MTKTTIKQAQYRNEVTMMRIVRRYNRNGEGYRPTLLSVKLYNALDRLVNKGKARYRRSRSVDDKSYVMSGYWLRQEEIR